MDKFKQRFGSVMDEMEKNEDFSTRVRNMLPKDTQDVIAVFLLLLSLPTGFFFSLFGVLPETHEIFSEGWIWRAVILSFLGINGYLNVYKMKQVGPNGCISDLPALLKPGFHYCHNCQLNVPSRSHHCPVCDKCVFRRDHHCSFAAVCVGHFNQRYFIAAVANFWIVTLVVLTWNWSYMWSAFGTFTLLQYWQLILPHLALFFRFISLSQFFCIMIFVFTLTTFFFLTYLGAAQLFCLYRGQTRVEYLLDIHAFNLGFMENIRQALGRRWMFIFLSPFIPSPLNSDGLSFHTKQNRAVAETTKAM